MLSVVFKALLAKLQEWQEQFARWQAQDYLSCWLAVRTGAPKRTKYAWGLHGKNATWRRLMDGDNHNQLIAHTSLDYQGRKVVVGGWFSYSDVVMSPEAYLPLPINVHTAVLKQLPIFTSDWAREPVQFDNSATFAKLAAQC